MFAPVAVMLIVGATPVIRIITFLIDIKITVCVSPALHTDGIAFSEDGSQRITVFTTFDELNKHLYVFGAVQQNFPPDTGKS